MAEVLINGIIELKSACRNYKKGNLKAALLTSY